MRIVQIYKDNQLTPAEQSISAGNVSKNTIQMQGNALPHFSLPFDSDILLTITSFTLVKYFETPLYQGVLQQESSTSYSTALIKSEINNNKIRFYFDSAETIGTIGIYAWILTLSDGTIWKTLQFYVDPIIPVFSCSLPDYNQTTEIFSLTITRDDLWSVALPIAPYDLVITAYNGETLVKNEIFSGTLASTASVILNFNITGLTVTKIEWTGVCNNFVLFAKYQQSNAVSIGANFALEFYDTTITIASITSNEGTATLQIIGNKIVTLTQGTLYDLIFEDSGATEYRVVFSEGGIQTVHCVLTSELLLVTGLAQIKQDILHYNNSVGVTELTEDNTGQKIYVPYTESKVKIYTP